MPDGDNALKEDLLPRTSDWPNGACDGPRYSTSLGTKNVTPKLTNILTSQYRWGEAKPDTPSHDIREEVAING